MKNKLLLSILAIVLSVVPKVNFGQAPNLGAASSFAFFTSSGAFGNTGATSIIGDIGTNVGALTGFPPGTFVGQSHIADSVSAQAALDVDTAYTYMSGITCDTTLGATLGVGQILTPRVYCILTATSLDGELTLDAQNDSSALFIFKITGALLSTSFSKVTLINSASFKNVYWQINGAFGLGDSSAFQGTVVANGAINLANGASILGRALTRAGAITLYNNTSELPVKLLSFNATCAKQYVEVKWSTASETNNDYYSIERKSDETVWQTIGTIHGIGNSSAIVRYSFIDKEPLNSRAYYRLKQTDLNGKFEYFTTIAVNNCQEDVYPVTIYPNPTSGQINLSFNGNKEQFHSVSIYNVMGKRVYYSASYLSSIDVSELKEGVYFLHFNTSSKNVITKLAIKK